LKIGQHLAKHRLAFLTHHTRVVSQVFLHQPIVFKYGRSIVDWTQLNAVENASMSDVPSVISFYHAILLRSQIATCNCAYCYGNKSHKNSSDSDEGNLSFSGSIVNQKCKLKKDKHGNYFSFVVCIRFAKKVHTRGKVVQTPCLCDL